MTPRRSAAASPFADIRLAVVGCGAVTTGLHLPALAIAGMTPAVLVDPDIDRARALAAEYGVAQVVADPAECSRYADAAIVAVPITYHADVARGLLADGVDVMVEKPLARTREECDSIIDVAREHGRVLGVNLMRRFLSANRWLHDMLRTGALGEVRSVDISEGYAFDWPVTSFGFFSRDNGGVLKDLGSHTLDLVHWHFGTIEVLSYRDNAYGGVETDCLLEFTTARGVPGILELSRGRSTRNTFVVTGEHATVEMQHFGEFIRVSPSPGGHVPAPLKRTPRGDQLLVDLFVESHADWLGAVHDRRAPFVDPTDAAAIVDVHERCRTTAQRWIMPWVETP